MLFHEVYYSVKEFRKNDDLDNLMESAILTFREFSYNCKLYELESGFQTPKFHALYELGVSRREIGPCRFTETSSNESKHHIYRKNKTHSNNKNIEFYVASTEWSRRLLYYLCLGIFLR